MTSTDELLLKQLITLGYAHYSGDAMDYFTQLSSNELIKLTLAFWKDSDFKYAFQEVNLTDSIASKYGLCQEIIKKLNAHGKLTHEISVQTLLYPDSQSAKKLIIFLIEKLLPKKEAQDPKLYESELRKRLRIAMESCLKNSYYSKNNISRFRLYNMDGLSKTTLFPLKKTITVDANIEGKLIENIPDEDNQENEETQEAHMKDMDEQDLLIEKVKQDLEEKQYQLENLQGQHNSLEEEIKLIDKAILKLHDLNEDLIADKNSLDQLQKTEELYNSAEDKAELFENAQKIMKKQSNSLNKVKSEWSIKEKKLNTLIDDKKDEIRCTEHGKLKIAIQERKMKIKSLKAKYREDVAKLAESMKILKDHEENSNGESLNREVFNHRFNDLNKKIIAQRKEINQIVSEIAASEEHLIKWKTLTKNTELQVLKEVSSYPKTKRQCEAIISSSDICASLVKQMYTHIWKNRLLNDTVNEMSRQQYQERFQTIVKDLKIVTKQNKALEQELQDTKD